MDFSTRLFAFNLNRQVAKLAAAGKPFLAMSWQSQGRDYVSVLFQIGRSAGVLEYFSDVFDEDLVRTHAAGFQAAPVPRYAFKDGEGPSDVFPDDEDDYLYAAAVSHFVSDMAASHIFQTEVLGMTQVDEFLGDDGAVTRAYVQAPNADASFSMIPRPTTGVLFRAIRAWRRPEIRPCRSW